MSDRRNPYLILGLDHGADAAVAAVAFARVSRRLRGAQAAELPYSMEDLTWALHQIEQVKVDPDASLDTFRVPADPAAYNDTVNLDDLLPPTPPIERRTTPGIGRAQLATAIAVTQLRSDLQAGVQAAIGDAVIFTIDEKAAKRLATAPRLEVPSRPSPLPGSVPDPSSSRVPAWAIALGILVAIIVLVGVVTGYENASVTPPEEQASVDLPESNPKEEPHSAPEPDEADGAVQLPNTRPVLQRGSGGQDTRDLQQRLGLQVDGVFGAGTERAVRDFQQQAGLRADGVVGEKTWRTLGLLAEPEGQAASAESTDRPSPLSAWVRGGDCLRYTTTDESWEPSRCVNHDGEVVLSRRDAVVDDDCPTVTDLWFADDWGVYCVMIVTDRTSAGGHWGIGPLHEGSCLSFDGSGYLIGKSRCGSGAVPVLTTASTSDGCEVSWAVSDYWVYIDPTDGTNNYICIDRYDWESAGLAWRW